MTVDIEKIQNEILEQNFDGKNEGFDAGYAAGHSDGTVAGSRTAINKIVEHLEAAMKSPDWSDDHFGKPVEGLVSKIFEVAFATKFQGKYASQAAAKKALMSSDDAGAH